MKKMAATAMIGSAILIGCYDQPIVPAPRVTRVIIFADVTASLLDEERQKVAKVAGEYIAQLPQGAEFWLYPVTADMPKAQLIYADKIPVAETTTEKNQLAEWRDSIAADIETEVQRLAANLNTPEHIQMRSCIFGALDVAQRQIDSIDKQRVGAYTVVFISDMLEECEQTPLGRVIDISDATMIVKEREALQNAAGEYPNLAGVKVVAMIPTTEASQPRITHEPRPPLHDLRKFWQVAMEKCNVSQESFWLDSDDRAPALQ